MLSGLSSGLATSHVALLTKQLPLALVFFVGLLAPTCAVAAAPELPRAYVDTSMPDTTGYVTKTVCASGCNFTGLQAAVNDPSVKNATTGIILSLTAGETFGGVSGTAVTLPVHTNPWIIIQSSQVASLPAGQRVTAASAVYMPRITVGQPGGFIQPYVIGIPASGAHHYRFIGLEVTTENVFAYYLFYFGAYNQVYPYATTLAMAPHHLIVDRCYVHGYETGPAAGSGPYSGVRADSGTTAIIDSRISDIALAGQEVQAISATNGPGPFKIVNNYLEAAGENVIFGGGDPGIPNMVASDIEVRRNYFTKKLSWHISDPSFVSPAPTVKNIFELKNAQRVLVDGNLMEYNWEHGQNGIAILFTPRDQSGTAPWSVVQDVTFTNNIVRHAAGAFNMIGIDDIWLSQPLARVAIRNNLFVDIGDAAGAPVNWGSNPFFSIGVGRVGAVRSDQGNYTDGTTVAQPGATDIVIEHNTAVSSGSPVMLALPAPRTDKATGFVFRYNIVPHNLYGVHADGSSAGTTSLDGSFTGYIFTGNALCCGNDPTLPGYYPSGNYFPATEADVKFVNAAGGDYRLAAGSPYHNAAPDGTDLGVDFAALAAALGGASSTGASSTGASSTGATGAGTGTVLPAPSNLTVK